MEKYLKLIYNMFDRMPVVCRFAAGARNSYIIGKQHQRFGTHTSPELLWSIFWNTSVNRMRISSRTPLIIRKALAFQRALKLLQDRVEQKGIGVLLGKDIPFFYPNFTLPQEENLIEVDNLTPGFDYVLEKGLNGIEEEIQKLDGSHTKEAFIIVIESMKAFIDNISALLSTKKFEPVDGITAEDIRSWIDRVPWYSPSNFGEALYAVWLLHLLCWYDNHKLIGLGRVDKWLWPYLERDLAQGRLTDDKALDSIKHFIRWLNNSRLRKSNVLLGDTGQTLIIGGLDRHGHEETNLLSFLFIKALEELKLPEPKLVARINPDSPDVYIAKLAELIKLNLGYPLLCNDEVIIAALIGAGYSEEDAMDYGVAACWEYFIAGRSFDRANIEVVSFLTPILAALKVTESQNVETFDEFMSIYKDQLCSLIQEKVLSANSNAFIASPFLSIMYPDCVRKGTDITEGGARYNNYGFLGMGLADAVDSLYVIKMAIFETKLLPIEQLQRMLRQDFDNNEKDRLFFLHRFPKFGNDNDDVDKIASDIVEIFASLTKQHKTPYGGWFRPGLGSAGEYIYTAKDTPATPNGRRKGNPCAVNLSPSPGAPRFGPTAILRSVTKPELKRMSNCAVMELAINTSFLSHEVGAEEQWIKWLIQSFVILGGAELQFNIIDAKVLREAQAHPELYRNLLVRVWGFNAYFIELPREFQDHIIARVESCAI